MLRETIVDVVLRIRGVNRRDASAFLVGLLQYIRGATLRVLHCGSTFSDLRIRLRDQEPRMQDSSSMDGLGRVVESVLCLDCDVLPTPEPHSAATGDDAG